MSDGILKFSNAEGVTAYNRYPNFLTNYGDFGALQRIGFATGTGSSNALSFSGIISAYQDLFIVVQARSTNASTTTNAILTFNGDVSNSNYSTTILNGDGSSASSNRTSNFAQMYCLDGMPAASATASIFSSATIHILNYANTSTFKTVLIRQAADLNGSGLTRLTVGLWRSTAAISSLTLNTFQGNFAAGSTAALYGVRASAA